MQLLSTFHPDEDVFATQGEKVQNKFDEHGNEQAIGPNGFTVLQQVGTSILTGMKNGSNKNLVVPAKKDLDVSMVVSF